MGPREGLCRVLWWRRIAFTDLWPRRRRSGIIMGMADDPRKDYVAVLYDRLRALARARMLGQRTGHTLDPTGLANEAIVRLLKCDSSQVNDEDHFLRLATEAMRQILVDH